MADRRQGSLWDGILVALLLGSVGLVFWYASSEDPQLRRVLEFVDLGLCAFFIVEWAVRGVRSGKPTTWGLRHSWELLGMVPLLLPLPGFLRILRLLRLVRILRVFGAVGARIGVWERIAKESSIAKIALASGLVTLAGAVLVWLLERDANGGLESFPEALWWAIVTVTTVGYGDITPVTATGRFVAGLLMISGIGTIGLLASSLASVLVHNRDQVANQSPGATGGVPGDLEALSRLHLAGRLTDDEYSRAKDRILR